jgi:2-octaprenyl-6-methoxyphenol hydroxylase
MTQDYDIVIVGAGMVGASLACALANSSYRIALLETKPFGRSEQPSYDERSVALAYGSKNILSALNLWPCIENCATPIRAIHVSQRGSFGVVRLSCTDADVDALGYVVANHALGRCFYQTLAGGTHLTVITPARLEDLSVGSTGVRLSVTGLPEQTGQRTGELTTRLVVAADGSASRVRDLVGIKIRRAEYGQTAIVTTVTPERAHQGIAYERFTDTGPLALLPMDGGRCSVVWVTLDHDLDTIINLDDARFLNRLQERFGYRLGRFKNVASRHVYPLSLITARDVAASRVVLLGNAAHSLHPVAGQGFNLALRDVAVLAELLCAPTAEEQDPGGEKILNQFARWREVDLIKTIRFTDTLARIFTNPLGLIARPRGLGLLALDFFPPLRRALARYGMGITGRLPRLAAGVPLRCPE